MSTPRRDGNGERDDAFRIFMRLRLDAVGEALVATPAIRLLASVLPQPRITLMAGPLAADVMRGSPYLHDVWVRTPTRPRDTSGFIGLIETVRASHFDASICFSRTSWRVPLSTAIARVPVRASFEGGVRTLLFTHRAMWSEHQHRAETALDLAGLTATALGAGDGVSAHRDGTSIKPQLWIQPSELEAARERLLGMGLSLDQPIIGMNTGANRERSAREWAPERFAEAANALAYKMRASVVLLGNGAQRAVGNRVKELLRCPAVNLCGETGLREAFAIASMCRLWLGNDGGLLHVAAAVCPAVVGVFDPYTAMVWGYRLPTCRTVYSSAHEGSAPEPDTKPFTRWAGAALDAVSAEQVTAAGFEVLKASESVAIQAHATRVSSPDGVA